LEARVRSQATSCGICGGEFNISTGFSPNTFLSPGQYHFTNISHSSVTDYIILAIEIFVKKQNKD
jgi:hypothetical protein